MQPDDYINNVARLAWACRRGMLELDVLLGTFLKEAYTTLSPADKHLFVELLGCADPEIFGWLLGSNQPADPGLLKMVKMVQAHARTRIHS